MEQVLPSEVEARIDDKTFIDKTSGRLFRRYRYFDFDVIQDIETGFINAGKFVRDVVRGQQKKKELDMFKRTDDWKLVIELGKQMISRSPGNPGDLTNSEIEAYMLRVYHDDYGNDVKGTYVPYRVFQLVALWADKKHKLAILELLESINERANAEAISAYEEIRRIKEQLEIETKELKSKIEEKDELLELKESLIQKLTTPINPLASPEAIYASPKGGNEFQLRYQKQPISNDSPTPVRIRYINVMNAQSVRDTATKILIQQGLVFTGPNRNRLISRDNLELVFSIIDKISKNESIDIPIQEHKKAFLANELNRLKLMVQTGPVVGKIYQRQYELENESLIPWEVIPIQIINKYNETHRDNGFDSEMEYAEGLFNKERMEAFHDLYVEILEGLIRKEDV